MVRHGNTMNNAEKLLAGHDLSALGEQIWRIVLNQSVIGKQVTMIILLLTGSLDAVNE
jgi:hypothetical protein